MDGGEEAAEEEEQTGRTRRWRRGRGGDGDGWGFGGGERSRRRGLVWSGGAFDRFRSGWGGLGERAAAGETWAQRSSARLSSHDHRASATIDSEM